MIEEHYTFKPKLKRNLLITGVVGILFIIIGIIQVNTGGHHDEGHGSAETHAVAESHAGDDASHDTGHADDEHASAEEAHGGGEHHGSPTWLKRFFADLWINNMFFFGLAVIGAFFFALQWAAQAGWSAGIVRIPMAMASWIPIGLVLILGVFFMAKGDLFHWSHSSLYDPNSPDYDKIIAGKEPYLNLPFYLARTLIIVGVYYLLFRMIRKNTLEEDLNGGQQYWRKNVVLAAIFLVVFGFTSPALAWDWVLSIDTHWFSTMFGWYVFASWFVSGLAFLTLVVVFLKEAGYLSIVNENHLHDLGKFVFAFSIFWTYIWFSQFLLIYYANIPEETFYFVERWKNDHYAPYFFINLILNFFFPFLVLMTRDSKRYGIFLKIACSVVLFGHWIDFYLMVTPGVMKEDGGFGFLEIGTIMVYLSAFTFVVLGSLAKNPLVQKNHPMLEESLHHHI